MISSVDSWPRPGLSWSNSPIVRNPSFRKGFEGSGTGSSVVRGTFCRTSALVELSQAISGRRTGMGLAVAGRRPGGDRTAVRSGGDTVAS
jgi:hypothetical protein